MPQIHFSTQLPNIRQLFVKYRPLTYVVFTPCSACRKIVYFLVFCFSFFFFPKASHAQLSRHYATVTPVTETAGLLGTADVYNPANAATADPYTYATLAVSTILGGSSAAINLIFPTELPAGTTVYVRISNASAGLLSILGGNLTMAARKGANGADVSATIQKDLFSAEGSQFWAITPSVNFDRIRVKLSSGVALDGGLLYVHHAFYVTGTDPCSHPLYTTVGAQGINLDLLGSGPGVKNPANAIDADPASFSTLTQGSGVTISLGSYVYQRIYFGSPSNPGDDITLRIRKPGDVVALNAFNNVRVIAYNNNTVVYDASLTDVINTVSSVLGLDLLGLLNNGTPVDIPVSSGNPSLVFDNIELRYGNLVNVGLLTQGIEFYGASRNPAKPVVQVNNNTQSSLTVCEKDAVILSVTNLQNTASINWYTDPSGGTVLAAGPTWNVPASLLTPGAHTFYAEAYNASCSASSARAKVTVTVNALPAAPLINPATICAQTSATLSVNNPVPGIGYNWYTAGGQPITNTVTDGISYTTGALTSGTSYLVEARDKTSSCVSSTRTTATVTVVPQPGPPKLTLHLNP